MPKELSEMGPDRMLSRGEIRKSRTSFLVHRTNTMNFFLACVFRREGKKVSRQETKKGTRLYKTRAWQPMMYCIARHRSLQFLRLSKPHVGKLPLATAHACLLAHPRYLHIVTFSPFRFSEARMVAQGCFLLGILRVIAIVMRNIEVSVSLRSTHTKI